MGTMVEEKIDRKIGVEWPKKVVTGSWVLRGGAGGGGCGQQGLGSACQCACVRVSSPDPGKQAALPRPGRSTASTRDA